MNRRFGLCLLALTGSVQAVPVSRLPSGQIVNWPAPQAGELNLDSGTLRLPVPITPDGHFTLNQLSPEQVSENLHPILSFFKVPTLAPNCTGKGAAVPTNARYALLTLNTPDGQEIRFQTPDGQSRALLLFLTRPTTLRGTLTCPDAVYVVSGTYHAGLVLVPMTRKEQDGKTAWHWDDLLNLKNFQWRLTTP